MNIGQTLDTTFEALLAKVKNPRQKTSLERIKAACDYLDSMGLKISPTAIESYCLDRAWDGPKAQSIRNSKEVLLEYAELRRSGQTVQKKNTKVASRPEIADESLRAYVRLLEQERNQAVAARQRIETGLRKIPGVPVDELIGSGLTGSPAPSAPAPTIVDAATIAALRSLFDITKLSSVGLELYKDRIRQSSTNNVLLEKPHVEALRAILLSEKVGR